MRRYPNYLPLPPGVAHQSLYSRLGVFQCQVPRYEVKTLHGRTYPKGTFTLVFFDNFSPIILGRFCGFGLPYRKNSPKRPPEVFFHCFWVGFFEKGQDPLKIVGLK